MLHTLELAFQADINNDFEIAPKNDLMVANHSFESPGLHYEEALRIIKNRCQELTLNYTYLIELNISIGNLLFW